MGRRIALLIGNRYYTDEGRLHELEQAANDIDGLDKVYGGDEFGGFETRRMIDCTSQEIRREIELMYPDFDENTRLEMFARSAASGWTVDGYEAQ